MARDDLLIVAAVAVPVVAYMGNIGGFKTWADNAFKGTRPNIINPKAFEEQLPEKDIPKSETPKIGCYNAIVGGKAATCYRQLLGTKAIGWCVAGTDRCGFARAEWCRNLSPNSASCKQILGSSLAYAYPVLNPTEDRVSVA